MVTFSLVAVRKLFRKMSVWSWEDTTAGGGCSGAISTPPHTEIHDQEVAQTFGGEDVSLVRRTRQRLRVKGSEFFRGRRNTAEVIYLQAIPFQEKKISTGRSSYWLQLGEIL